MRAWGVVAVVLAAGAAAAADVRSGPQVGATVPGAFEPLNVNGPDAGEESCLFCKYGNAPVVMAFAARPSERLGKLARDLEAAAAARKAGEVGACVVVTETSAATRKALGKLADDANLKHVVLAVVAPEKVKAYELNPEAEVTVLLYSNRVVRSNFAFRAADLTDEALAAVATEARRHCGVK